MVRGPLKAEPPGKTTIPRMLFGREGTGSARGGCDVHCRSCERWRWYARAPVQGGGRSGVWGGQNPDGEQTPGLRTGKVCGPGYATLLASSMPPLALAAS